MLVVYKESIEKDLGSSPRPLIFLDPSTSFPLAVRQARRPSETSLRMIPRRANAPLSTKLAYSSPSRQP